MRVDKICEIYKNIFNKNLHAELKLAGSTHAFSLEFIELYRSKWMTKEIPILSLSNTVLDTDRWEYDNDLTVVMYGIKTFCQTSGYWLQDRLVYFDIEQSVSKFGMDKIMKLLNFVDNDKKPELFQYIRDMKELERWGH